MGSGKLMGLLSLQGSSGVPTGAAALVQAGLSGGWRPGFVLWTDVRNPATGEVVARVPQGGVAGATAAVDAAAAVGFEDASVDVRRGWLDGIARGLLAARADLAQLITLENGKPLIEAGAEVDYAAGFFRFFAGQLDRLEAEALPDVIRGCRWRVYRRAAGVAVLLTPWNFPLAMLAKKVSAGLGAGCGLVARPSQKTPLSALALAGIARQAGVSEARFQVVLGVAGPLTEVFCTHPAVRLISFTGSTEVGKGLMARAAGSMKRLALELGGNAPFIVFADADLPAAAAGLVANKFRAGGQTCVCTNRVYAEAPVEAEFCRLVVERVRQLRVGNGIEPGVDVGPLIDRAGFDKVQTHIRDAVELGAERLLGEDPPRPAQDWGAFYPPTVLRGVHRPMRVCEDETFGPVVAIARFTSEDEVAAEANATRHGLAAYVYGGDVLRLRRMAARLQFGHVGLNTGSGPTPEAPFGGMKESGFGREGGMDGLLEYCEAQTVAEAEVSAPGGRGGGR
jgi:succinate-semialdehyde dehydrogenase/glutarate-semialdehyde dehydrogenase